MKTRSLAALPSSLRRLNERAILRRLRRLGTASRAQLARESGISQPTAGKIIEELLAWGLIEELEVSANGKPGTAAFPRPGRPARLLRLNGSQPRFLGLELGVEQTRLARLPLAVTDDRPWEVVFATGGSPEAWAQELARHAAAVAGGPLWAVLVSVPGVVEETAGRVLYSPNLHWTERVLLGELITRVWDLPVLLVQEIRALALGQLVARPDWEDFLLVDFGEGVGGAVIEGGQLFSHPLPLSGELGHTPVLGNLRQCGCGARGCVETLLSLGGVRESLRAHRFPGSLAQWIETSGLPPWLRDALAAMGSIIAGALNVLGLRRVVITGHLTDLPPVVIQTLTDAVTRGAMWARFGQVECLAAPRRRQAGLVAAALDRLLFPMTAEGAPARAARRRMTRAATRDTPRGRRSPTAFPSPN